MVKRLPATQETRVRFLGLEDPLEKEIAIYSRILAWEILARISWQFPCHQDSRILVGYNPWGSQRVRQDWETNTLSVKKPILKKDKQLSWGHATSKGAEPGLGTMTQLLEIQSFYSHRKGTIICYAWLERNHAQKCFVKYFSVYFGRYYAKELRELSETHQNRNWNSSCLSTGVTLTSGWLWGLNEVN